jgi:hypothetical protein
MSDSRIGVVLMTILTTPPTEHLFVLDGIKTNNRPAAIGNFVLEIMRDAFRKTKSFPEVRIRMGTVGAGELTKRRFEGRDIRTNTLESDVIGDLYRLVVTVERGDEDILST